MEKENKAAMSLAFTAAVGWSPAANTKKTELMIKTEPPINVKTKDMFWTKLTYEGRTFEFNRDIHVRVIQEDGGWAFECDDPELMGFGHTREEAEETFCLGFAVQWDDLVCSKHGKLTEDAKEMASKLKALVKAQR